MGLKLKYTGKNAYIVGIPASDIDLSSLDLEIIFGDMGMEQIAEYLVGSGLYEIEKPKYKPEKPKKRNEKTKTVEENDND
jgi:hypothetical protein